MKRRAYSSDSEVGVRSRDPGPPTLRHPVTGCPVNRIAETDSPYASVAKAPGILLVALLSLWPALFPDAAQAIAPRYTSRGTCDFYFGGGHNENLANQSLAGAGATIGTDMPVVCAEKTNGDSSAWVAVESASGCGYAQAGWVVAYGSNNNQREWFAEYSDSNCYDPGAHYLGQFACCQLIQYQVVYNYTHPVLAGRPRWRLEERLPEPLLSVLCPLPSHLGLIG